MSIRFAGETLAIAEHGYFARAFESARRDSELVKGATSPFSHVDGTIYVLTLDKRSGFAVRPDGELVLVFSTVKGRGSHLVEHARHLGATHLDCFDGYLVRFYAEHGFERVTSLPNWTPGEPDVVFMARPGHALAALDKAESCSA
jgi:hypothetical protein